PLLQSTHVRGERRLIANGRRNTAKQRRDLRARLGETKDVVDEEQNILALVAEFLGNREAGETHAGTRTRWPLHLAINKRAFRTVRRTAMFARIDIHFGLDHLMIEVVALTRAFADAGEHGIAAVGLGDIVDELHNDDGLADPGASEEPDLA